MATTSDSTNSAGTIDPSFADSGLRPELRVRKFRDHLVSHGPVTVARDATVAALSSGAPAAVDPVWYANSLLIRHGIDAEPPLTSAVPGPVRLVASRRFATQGASVLGALAVVVATIGRLMYGGITLLLVLAGTFVLAKSWPALQTRADKRIPRGRCLGLTVMVPFVVVAVAIVIPLRQHHIDTTRKPPAPQLPHAASQADPLPKLV